MIRQTLYTGKYLYDMSNPVYWEKEEKMFINFSSAICQCAYIMNPLMIIIADKKNGNAINNIFLTPP